MTRSQALYLKWRPTRFEGVVGQEHVVRTIQNALHAERVAHAYLFSGPRGTGKTTTARLLAKALNCTHEDVRQRPDDTCPRCLAVNEGRYLDLIEIDAASHTGVDDIRDLREKINFSPGEGDYKVYIVDEVHMLSNAAFNALLKTLEEPPPHAIFVLATTEAHKVPLTVTSRCQRHTFRRISVTEIVAYLEMIVAAEEFQIEPEVLNIVARLATGSMRDAISLLDQLVVTPEELVTAARAREVFGISGGETVAGLVAAIAARQADVGLDAINEAVESGADPRQLARQTVDYLRGLLLIKMGSAGRVEVAQETLAEMEAQAAALSVRDLLHAVRAFDEATRNRGSSWLSQLPLELAFLSCLEMETAPASAPPVAAKPLPSKPVSPASETKPVSEAAPAPGGSVSLTELLAQWDKICDRSKVHHYTLPALLDWCRPVAVEGELLTLGFKKEFALSKVDSEEMRPLLEAAVADVIGQNLRVKCVRRDVDTAVDLPDVDEEGVVAMGVKLGARPKQLD